MGNYQLINEIPISGDYFADWKKRDARKFWKQILSSKNDRLNQLKNLVHQDPEYSNFVFDYSIKSLIPLSEWLKKNISIEPKPKEMYDLEIMQFRGMCSPSTFVLSLLTRTICLDLSLYYGEIMLKQLGDREWHIYTDTSYNNIRCGTMGIKVKTKNLLFCPLSTILVYVISVLEDGDINKTLESILKTQLNTIIEIESRPTT